MLVPRQTPNAAISSAPKEMLRAVKIPAREAANRLEDLDLALETVEPRVAGPGSPFERLAGR